MVGFRRVKAWEKSHRVTLEVYRVTRSFPREERYGLTAQMRRAAASVSANIAEGCGRRGRREFAQFLQIALGSASELEYHLLLAADLKLLDGVESGELTTAVIEVKRMLAGFIRRLTSDV
ncbi:MAG TPA: four helix bundle protein [Gemmatimonadales bacterium]